MLISSLKKLKDRALVPSYGNIPEFSQEVEVQATPFATAGLNQCVGMVAAQLLPVPSSHCLAAGCRGEKKKATLKPETEIAALLLLLLRCQLKRNHYKEVDAFRKGG